MLNIYYITLNTEAEAQKISQELLANQHAMCTNWFPITCAYRWEGEIKQEPEVVLLVKSKANKFADIEKIVKNHIDYTNCITQLATTNINTEFATWLSQEVR